MAAADMEQRWDFFVKHSDDEAREARYLHRTWRKPDGGFYVGIDPPEESKALGIVSFSSHSTAS
jgi:choline dehydrogenase